MRRDPSQYANCSPDAISQGSQAQMRFFVDDAKHDIALLVARVAELEAANMTLNENLRQNYDAFTAMRNDINEIVGNMVSQDEGVLRQGAGMSFECAAVVEAVRARIGAKD
jgi:hypothetical protein